MNEHEQERAPDDGVGELTPGTEGARSGALVPVAPANPAALQADGSTTWIGGVDADQAHARAGRDLIGGNQVNIGHYTANAASGPKRPIAVLLERLQEEVNLNKEVAEHIDELRYFETRRSEDGVDGLEAKLEKTGQQAKLRWALENKEQFAKALERWSLYGSAQAIFAHLLGRAYYEFGERILPKLGELTPTQITEIFDARFVQPTVDECGAGLLVINHSIAIGMVYWLAEQCFVRWHK